MRETVDRELELTLPMVPDIEVAAARAAGNLGRQMGMPSERVDEMAHAIIEACINAREHACCADQRIYLRFVAGTADGRAKIDVWIRDHGKGFDPVEARSRRHNANELPHRRGWGLQIIEAHMDEVDIESGPNGTTIHMVKYGD